MKNKIALTICPLSNLELKVVKDLKFHPLKKMLDLGMIATVNSDDPAYFGGYINDNFIKITESLNLNSSEIKKLAENSFQASMMDENDKEVWIKKVNTYFKNANA